MNNIIGIEKFCVWRESGDEKLPDVSFIPPMVRRRMTDLQKIAIGVAHKIVPENSDYSVVFASQFGEWQQTAKLITQFHNDSEMSPAGFSNSVHNAAAGAFSLLSHNKNSYISIAAGARTLESGVLMALMARRPVLFIFAEEKSPEMYEHLVTGAVAAHALAFMLSDYGHRVRWNNNAGQEIPLSFEKMANFLEHGGELVTNSWTMVDA